jgi:hypothetical protein
MHKLDCLLTGFSTAVVSGGANICTSSAQYSSPPQPISIRIANGTDWPEYNHRELLFKWKFKTNLEKLLTRVDSSLQSNDFDPIPDFYAVFRNTNTVRNTDVACRMHTRETEHTHTIYGCFKKSFTTLKDYKDLFREHVQCFELV